MMTSNSLSCDERLRETIPLSLLSSTIESPTCSICNRSTFTCSNNPNNINQENSNRAVTLGKGFKAELQPARWIWTQVYLYFGDEEPQDSEENTFSSQFNVQVIPQFINGSDMIENPPQEFEFEINDYSKTNCAGCSSAPLFKNEEDLRLLAQILNDAERVEFKLERVSGSHLCFSHAEIDLCRSSGDQKASDLRFSFEQIEQDDFIYWSTNITNIGPDPVPNPQFNISMPNLFSVENIEIRRIDSDPFSVSIRDQRDALPREGNFINANPLNPEGHCIIREGKQEFIQYWKVECELDMELEDEDSFQLNIIGDRSKSNGGRGDFRVRVGSLDPNWIPLLSEYESIVVMEPGMTEINIINQMRTAASTQDTSPKFLMTTNGTDREQSSLVRLLQIHVILSDREWALNTLDKSISLSVFDSYSFSNESRLTQFEFDPSQLTRFDDRDVSIAFLGIDLHKYDSDRIDLSKGAYTQLFANRFSSVSPFYKILATPQIAYPMSIDGSLSLDLSFFSFMKYFTLNIETRQNPLAQRTLILDLSLDSNQVELFLVQDEVFPEYFSNGDRLENSNNNLYSKDVDDLKAEAEGKSVVTFVGAVRLRSCPRLNCVVDIEPNMNIFIPEPLEKLDLDENHSQRKFNKSFPKLENNAQRSRREFSLNVSRSLLPDINELPFTAFVIDLKLNLEREAGISLQLELQKTFDNNRILSFIDRRIFDDSTRGHIEIDGLTLTRALDRVNITNNQNQIEFVLMVDLSSLPFEAQVTAELNLDLFRVERTSLQPFQDLSLRSDFNSSHFYGLNMIRFRPEELSITTLNSLSNFSSCPFSACFSVDVIQFENSTRSLCFDAGQLGLDIIYNTAVQIVPVPTQLQEYLTRDLFENITSSSDADLILSLIQTRFPSNGVSPSCNRDPVGVSYKPVQRLIPGMETPIQRNLDRYLNQSFMFAFAPSDFRDNTTQTQQGMANTTSFPISMKAEFSFFGDGEYYDFNDEDLFEEQNIMWTSNMNSTWYQFEFFDYSSPSYPHAYKLTRFLTQNFVDPKETMFYFYFRASLKTSRNEPESMYTSIGPGDGYQVSSIPIIYPVLGLAITPSVVYPLSIIIAVVAIITSYVYFERLEPYKKIIIPIIGAVALFGFVSTILCGGLSALNDCSSSIYCCSYGGYMEGASPYYDYLNHFEDQPLNQTSIARLNNTTQTTTDVDCLAYPNKGGSLEDARSVCMLGDVYETCARGYGALAIFAIVLSGLTLIALLMFLASLLLLYNPKEEGKEDEVYQ